MSLFDNIDPLIFLISLSIGMFLTYILTPKPKIVIKYPTPYNAGKVKYIDDAGVCYKYRMVEVDCPINKNEIKSFKLQSSNT